jgi:hypothetical protein
LDKSGIGGLRKSDLFLSWIAVGFCLLLVLFVHVFFTSRNSVAARGEQRAMVERYGLTDLCLFTDARYTRNPAVADRATAFQDHPISLEHFPSGSIVSPPARVKYGLD